MVVYEDNSVMDEQRIQAYLELIEKLRNCPPEQESSILQMHKDLVDIGLVVMMGHYVTLMEKKGDDNVGRLRQLAAHLAHVSRLEQKVTEGAAMEYAAQFLVKTLQLIIDTEGSQRQVHLMWAKQQSQLNTGLLELFPQIVAQLYQQNKVQKASIASTLAVFGDMLQMFPLGTRWLNLELSIAAYQQALIVRTKVEMPLEWVQTMNSLACAYVARIRGEKAQNIEDAIDIYQEVLALTTQMAMSVEWARTMTNLGIAYTGRILGDKAQNIEDAINVYQQALTVINKMEMPVKWAQTMTNLAGTYAARLQGNKAQNIENAIDACQQALTVRTQAAMPIEWAGTMNSLAGAYLCRIKGDRAQNIENAIDACRKALLVRSQTTMPLDWADTVINLANAYLYRIQGDQAQNIEDAITAYQQALTVRTQIVMPIEWAQTMNSLANAYLNRILGDKAQNIEDAINAYQQSLSVRTRLAMPIEWAQTMNNLANTYLARVLGDKAQNIEDAISACQQSLLVRTQSAMPIEWAKSMNNLAVAYRERILGNKAQNIENAINAYQSALGIFSPKLTPSYCRRTAYGLGNIYSGQKCWQKAVVTYQKALQSSEILYQDAVLLGSKAAELLENANLPRQTTYALAQVGDLRTAVVTLERGRARGLSESLDRDRTNLNHLQQQNPDLYAQYKELTNQIRNLEALQRDRMTSAERHSLTPETLRDKATRLRQQLTETIDEIRQQPGYETFLHLPTFRDIQHAASSDRPLVYLLTNPAGSLALIVTPNTTESVWLGNFTETQLTELVQFWFAAYSHSQSDHQAWYDAIDTTTRQLWQPLMEPLIRNLKAHSFNQVTLIPTGYLSLLPLHFAWIEDLKQPSGRRYALDEIHFTYTPNAKSLTAAQAIADRTATNTILAIDNPRNDLPNSSREVAAAIASFQQPVILLQEKATVAAVKAILPNTNIAHFACHGTAKLTDPLTSGLLMSDDLLTLRDIFALNLADHGGLRLAILSACETGISGIENIDEAISLPTGLLQAGVAGVIASLWAVSDLSTMLLLSKFYELWRTENKEPSEALRQAQIWLRDSTDGEKENSFPDFIALDRSDRSFTHPYHWGAFSYTGI